MNNLGAWKLCLSLDRSIDSLLKGFVYSPSSTTDSNTFFRLQNMDSSITNNVDKRPAPRDLSHHYSRVTKNRSASAVKDFYRYFSIPGIENLAGGMYYPTTH